MRKYGAEKELWKTVSYKSHSKFFSLENNWNEIQKFSTILSQPHIFSCTLYKFIQLYINVRPDLVSKVILHSYLQCNIQSDDGYIQPKHVAGFTQIKLRVGRDFACFLFALYKQRMDCLLLPFVISRGIFMSRRNAVDVWLGQNKALSREYKNGNFETVTGHEGP
jgi:hypothetical protein